MATRDALYELLLDYANLKIEVERVLVGLNWTLCQAGSSGIAETTGGGEWRREIETPLAGRSLAELSLWLRKWDRQQSAIGLAAVNAAINSEADMVYHEGAQFRGSRALINALEWFTPRIKSDKVVLLGSENPFNPLLDLTHLPGRDGALHPAADVILGKAEWVFVEGQSVADKTLPRILELAGNANVVLYGPQVPWLEEWRNFGIDYIVGGQIEQSDNLYHTIAEGGGIESLPQALSYRVCDLNCGSTLPLPLPKSGAATLVSH